MFVMMTVTEAPFRQRHRNNRHFDSGRQEADSEITKKGPAQFS
jgi:hypothetical protein